MEVTRSEEIILSEATAVVGFYSGVVEADLEEREGLSIQAAIGQERKCRCRNDVAGAMTMARKFGVVDVQKCESSVESREGNHAS